MHCSVSDERLLSLLDFDPDAWHDSELPELVGETATHAMHCPDCKMRIALLHQVSSNGLPAVSLTNSSEPDDPLFRQALDRVRGLRVFANELPTQSHVSDSGTALEECLAWLRSELEPLESHGADAIGMLAQYEVRTIIGHGGMAVVAQARDTLLDRDVAIKFLQRGFATEVDRRRFEREARAAALVRHESAISVYEIVESHSRLLGIVMPLMNGGNLQERLALGPLSIRAAVDIACAIADGLGAAHACGLLHRDVKPSNILFGADGKPMLADFGLAREVSESHLTADGVLPGTPEYLCPECIAGSQASVRSDVYQLGMTLYAMLTGRSAFRGNVHQVLDQIQHAPPTRVESIRVDVPGDLATICMKSIERDPLLRYASATAMRDDLRAFREVRPIAARPVSRMVRAWYAMRRHPRHWAAASMAAASLLFVGALALAEARRRASAESHLLVERKSVQHLQGQVDQAMQSVAGAQSQLFSAVLVANQVAQPSREAISNKLYAGLLQGLVQHQSQLLRESPSSPQLAGVSLAIGTMRNRLGEHASAIEALRHASDIMAASIGQSHPSAENIQQVVSCQLELALALLKTEQSQPSIDSCQEAIDLLRNFDRTESPHLTVELAKVHVLASDGYRISGQRERGLDSLSKARDAQTMIVQQYSKRLDWPGFSNEFFEVCRSISRASENFSNWNESLQWSLWTSELYAKAWRKPSSDEAGADVKTSAFSPEQLRWLAVEQLHVARMRRKLHQVDQARASIRDAVEKLEAAARDSGNSSMFAEDFEAADRLKAEINDTANTNLSSADIPVK